MPIPTQTEMFPVVLEVMSDGESRSNREIRDAVAEHLNLSPDELDLKTRSGEPIHASRSGWGIQYLQRAQLLDRVQRGVYRINKEGLEVAARKPRGTELSQLMNRLIAERNPWNVGADAPSNPRGNDATGDDESDLLSPQESIERAISELQSSLADELLDQILAKPPEFFEKLIVDLLVRMGYGTGKTTQLSNDGGIDGIITTDSLGFDPVYTQAKRYAFENKVGRPDVQAFAGALGRYTRGIFITTSSFVKSAHDYAESYPHATIVLIDGRRLAQLMIQHDLGVSTERTYSIKRIDIDYFDQD